ncbi:RNA polymerase sigma factor [Planctomycetota bacterium]
MVLMVEGPANKQSDSGLLKKAILGEKSAFGKLYARYGDTLFRYAMAMSADPSLAEDLLHDCFIQLLENPDAFQGRGSFKAYLLSIIRHRFIKIKRRRVIENKLFSSLKGQIFWSKPARGEVPFGTDDISNLNEVLRQLPVEQREVVILKIHEDLNFGEIGTIMSCSPKTAESRYYLALSKLKEKFRGKPGI